MCALLEVIESIQDTPIRFLPGKEQSLNIGDIVDLTEEDGNPCCIVSSGKKPFGIVSEINGSFGLVSVFYDTMVLRTNNYETNCMYKTGDSLYASENGKLTTKAPFEDSYRLGTVIIPPGADRVNLEMNWI